MKENSYEIDGNRFGGSAFNGIRNSWFSYCRVYRRRKICSIQGMILILRSGIEGWYYGEGWEYQYNWSQANARVRYRKRTHEE